MAEKKLTGKKPKLGSGKRFDAIAKEAAASGSKNPEAVAAAVGRKKYGEKKMEQLSLKGKRDEKNKKSGK